MDWKAARPVFRTGVLLLFCLIANLAQAQAAATLTGTITDAAGKTIAGARITARNDATGQSVDTQTGSTGSYTLQNLASGSYTVSVMAEGFIAKESKVTLTAAGQKTLDMTLVTSQQLPNAPGAAPSAPTLSDLGFSEQQTQADPKLQAMLDKRTAMLKMHQRLGLITAAPMAAALITGPMASAKGRNGQTIKEPTNANLDFHAALGGTTTVLYFTTAYFAIRAPKVPGVQKHGAIRMHEALAFIHGPGMILTPILGAMAYNQENNGEKVHGIASAHGAVAVTTAIAYGASIVAVSWPIHVKFWEKR
ncbi:MAG TPA: carboxypeptidase-like regulatory domain-containing protein [Terracidiphilus sp.]|nr:carboxypeptidase-like regulatory domain-containing protein [Terracidiphilus sp.]